MTNYNHNEVGYNWTVESISYPDFLHDDIDLLQRPSRILNENMNINTCPTDDNGSPISNCRKSISIVCYQ